MMVNDKNKNSCSTIIQNFTSHSATLPRGIIGYIEIPITQTIPSHYRVHGINSLIHSVIHAYSPDTTIQVRQNENTDMTLCNRKIPQSLLEINKIEVNEKTHFNYPYLQLQEIFDRQTKLEKIFLLYLILQKINNLYKNSILSIPI